MKFDLRRYVQAREKMRFHSAFRSWRITARDGFEGFTDRTDVEGGQEEELDELIEEMPEGELKAWMKKLKERKKDAPVMSYTRRQSAMFDVYRAWIRRYDAEVVSRLEEVVLDPDGVRGIVDREAAVALLRRELKDAERWEGVCCGESNEEEEGQQHRPVFRAAWGHVKEHHPHFYHAYCILAQVDRLFTGYFAEQQHGDMRKSASLIPYGLFYYVAGGCPNLTKWGIHALLDLESHRLNNPDVLRWGDVH